MTTDRDPVDLEALAAPLRAVVAEIDAGELTAGAVARAFLAGALAGLDAARTGQLVPLPPTSRR